MKDLSNDIDQVVDQYKDMVYKLALSQTRNRHAADEVFQEVFLSYMRHKKTFQDEHHRKSWFIQVTIYRSRSYFTSTYFKYNISLDYVDFPQVEKQSYDVYRFVLNLPLKYRRVIHLFYYEELSIKEIAYYLNEKESTVRSQLKRGREKLKMMMKESDENEKI